jgi:hypothetical protein
MSDTGAYRDHVPLGLGIANLRRRQASGMWMMNVLESLATALGGGAPLRQTVCKDHRQRINESYDSNQMVCRP